MLLTSSLSGSGKVFSFFFSRSVGTTTQPQTNNASKYHGGKKRRYKPSATASGEFPEPRKTLAVSLVAGAQCSPSRVRNRRPACRLDAPATQPSVLFGLK